MHHVWQLQEAKSRLSELIVEAESAGPQVITKRGVEAVIVISCRDYKKLLSEKESLVDFFRDSPLADAELDLSRDKSPIRHSDFS